VAESKVVVGAIGLRKSALVSCDIAWPLVGTTCSKWRSKPMISKPSKAPIQVCAARSPGFGCADFSGTLRNPEGDSLPCCSTRLATHLGTQVATSSGELIGSPTSHEGRLGRMLSPLCFVNVCSVGRSIISESPHGCPFSQSWFAEVLQIVDQRVRWLESGSVSCLSGRSALCFTADMCVCSYCLAATVGRTDV